MDFGTQSHASYIPKKPLAAATPSGYSRRHLPLGSLVTILIFIASVGLAGGLYVYQIYLERDLEAKKISLEQARAAFDPALILELRRLDKRIEHSKRLLSRHSAMSSFFDLLGSATLKNVQFTSMLFSQDGADQMKVVLNGAALTYASVALQSDAFNVAKGIRNPIFSGLNLNEKGNVSFVVEAGLDPEAFRYSAIVTPSPDTSETEESPVDAFAPESSEGPQE